MQQFVESIYLLLYVIVGRSFCHQLYFFAERWRERRGWGWLAPLETRQPHARHRHLAGSFMLNNPATAKPGKNNNADWTFLLHSLSFQKTRVDILTSRRERGRIMILH